MSMTRGDRSVSGELGALLERIPGAPRTRRGGLVPKLGDDAMRSSAARGIPIMALAMIASVTQVARVERAVRLFGGGVDAL